MALPDTPERIIDESDPQLAGVYLRADSRTEEAETSIFLNEQQYEVSFGVVRPAREGILDKVWEEVDLTGAQFEYAVGRLNQAPTDGSFDLSYDGSTDSLLFLEALIGEDDLQAAFQANEDLTAIANFTVASTTVTVGAPHQLGPDLRVRVSSTGTLPSPLVAGTDYWVKTAGSDTTLELAASQGGSAIVLTGGSGTHTLHKTIDVEQTGRVYRVQINQYAAHETFQADAENLNPPSQVIINHAVIGDADTLDVQTIRIVQSPFAFQDSFTLVAPGTVGLTVEEAGDNETPAKYLVEFSGPPTTGKVSFSHSVPQVTEIVTTANTASAAQFTLEFSPISGSEAAFGGSFVDVYKEDHTPLRIWFDYNDTSVAPTAPENGTLLEIDYTSIANLITDFTTVVGALADFNAPTTLSATKVQVTYTNKGARTSLSIAGAPDLSALTSKMVTNGSDGVHVGRYFTIYDRNGLNCVYMIGGLTDATDFPDVGDLTINRYIPVTLTADGTANAVAVAIAAALEADDEYTAPVPGGNTATVTDAFGGSRGVTVSKTVTFGVSVKRAGFNVAASIPWNSDASAIATLINPPGSSASAGTLRYKVSKDDPLHWAINLLINGTMPNPALADESLAWPSRVKCEMDFRTLALELAFGATTANFLDATEELVYIPDGGTRRTILQRNCRLQRNMISAGGLSIPPFTTTLTRVPTGKVLWVDVTNGNDSSGTRGRLDKQYLTPTGAQTDALAGDTIVVMPGSYTTSASLAKDEVNYHLMPGVTITMDSDSNIGIFDDGGTAMQFTVTGEGDLVRTNSGSSSGMKVINASHADSVISVTVRDITVTDTADVENSAILGVAGELFVKFRKIISTGPPGQQYGIWWLNGRLHAEGALVQSEGYATYGDVDSAPTGDFFVRCDEIVAPNTAYMVGSNSAAAMWVEALIMRGTITSAGAGRLYVHFQKQFGTILALDTALYYIEGDKISATQNGVSGGANMLHATGGDGYLSVKHWDRDTFTGETIKITGGTVRMLGGGYFVTGTAKGIELTGGTLECNLDKVDASANSSSNPITFSGGTLVLGSNLYLKSQGSRDSVETGGAALTIYAKGAWANNSEDGAATVIGLLNASVAFP